MTIKHTTQGDNRIICWFSCGAASAVAAYLALKKYGDRAVVANIYIESEHPDNQRFLADCERWYGRKIEIITNEDYNSSIDDVFEKRRYLSGPSGAPCTGLLKKVPRYAYQRHDDLHIFGYTADEAPRAKRAIEQNPELDMEFPLIDAMLSHQDCIAMINNVGIEIPTMYKLGFRNNNCIGCVKSGSPAYWNRIRSHFPDVYARRAKQERDLNHALCRIGGVPVFLDELPETVVDDEHIDLSCSLLCQIALGE
jgi:3'-phosphoadenosine 5'-phosphosulfate sulfotransferase (PAPS reductase)/FAD synthetase